MSILSGKLTDHSEVKTFDNLGNAGQVGKWEKTEIRALIMPSSQKPASDPLLDEVANSLKGLTEENRKLIILAISSMANELKKRR